MLCIKETIHLMLYVVFPGLVKLVALCGKLAANYKNEGSYAWTFHAIKKLF